MQDNHTPKPSQPQSTIAPSEKHLEDWIIAHPDRIGEPIPLDWVPEYARPDNPYMVNEDEYLSPYFNNFVGRQISLPNGRADLVMVSYHALVVVELKKGPITYDVIGQCMRYISDLDGIYSQVLTDAQYSGAAGKSYFYHQQYYSSIRDIHQNEIWGMVVGHGVQDKNIPIVAEACGIKTVQYQYNPNEDEYTFEEVYSEFKGLPSDVYGPYLGAKIAKAMRYVASKRVEHLRKMGSRQVPK